MKKIILIIVLLISFTGISADKDFYPAKTCHDCLPAELEKRLSKATTDLERLKTLHSLILAENKFQQRYFDRFFEINKKANLMDDRPYRLYNKVLIALQQKEAPGKVLGLYKDAIAAFDEKGQEIITLLTEMRLVYNAMEDQEGKKLYFSKKLSNYLERKQYDNAGGCYHSLAGYYVSRGDINSAINHYLKAAELLEPVSKSLYLNEMMVVSSQYVEWGNMEKGEEYLKTALANQENTRSTANNSYMVNLIATVAYEKGNYEKALALLDQKVVIRDFPEEVFYISQRKLLKAFNLIALGRTQEAYPLLKEADSISRINKYKVNHVHGFFENDFCFYKYYSATGNTEMAGRYLEQALKAGRNNTGLFLKYSKELFRFHNKFGKYEEAARYSEIFINLNDSLKASLGKFNIASYEGEKKELQQSRELNALQQDYVLQQERLKQRNQILLLSVGGLLIVLVLSVFVYRQLVINKKVLHRLRKTQAQLIQSEKMASMGELTAGIAHEIQNPLNFVNNFSEVSIELLDELKEELAKGDTEEAITIAGDVSQNLEKINHHGRRADSIVKGMLQHSRASSGQKDLTDINALTDEYLRLAYHGLRAKDKSFNAELITHFDDSLPKVQLIPQDIGRVLLNLFTNAFYATQEKASPPTLPTGRQAPEGGEMPPYKPAITVTTRMVGNSVEIIVKDNGTGIPEAIKDKILQPFFTTKPTGEGTGLGLSLSYDIVVKGHGGSIAIDSKEGEGSEFIISLPVA